MNNMTKQVVRHFNHKHSRFLQHFLIEDKLKLLPLGSESSNITANALPQSETNNCFSNNQVLVIIAVTCFLNFAFIILIMMCVQILGSTSKDQENSEKDVLLYDQSDITFGETSQLTNCELSKIRLASLPDNIITKKVAEHLFKSKQLKSKCEYATQEHDLLTPVSKTYHFTRRYSFNSDDSENEADIQNYSNDSDYKWKEEYAPSYTAVFDLEANKNVLFNNINI